MTLNRVGLIAGVLLMVAIITSGCDEVELKLDLDLYNRSYLSFINNSDIDMTFYVKNDANDGSVFSDRYRLTQVQAQHASREFSYRWLKGIPKNQIASRDSNLQTVSNTITPDFEDGAAYWAIIWQLSDNHYRLSSFKKQQRNIANEFQVRIFANARLEIDLNRQTGTQAFTQAGQVSMFYSVAQCGDLRVGNIPIDLCQYGEIGGSYLVVLDQNGNQVIVRE